MPLSHFKRMLGVLLGLCIAGIAPFRVAFAETPVSLNEIGVRYYAMEGELCLTRDQVPEAALQLLGVDEETLLSAMERDNQFLICLTSDGRQVSLRCLNKPVEIEQQNSLQLSVLEKEQFLTLLARSGHYLTAAWQSSAPGFALFSTAGINGVESSPALHTVALSTLYLDRIYSFQTDIIGRMPADADTELLLSIAARTLFLGAAEPAASETDAEPALPALPEPFMFSGETAAFQESIGSIPLTLSPVSAVIPTTTLTLSGQTSPNAYIRYSVNGKASSRFKADDRGEFTVTMPRLLPDEANTIEVKAFEQAEVSTIRFDVAVDWQDTPLALSKTGGEVQGESFSLCGITLPGATVQLIRRQGSTDIPTEPDGSFIFSIPTNKMGENAFTIRASAPGYRRMDVDITVTRTYHTEEELSGLRRKVKTVDYDKLCAKPATYKNRMVELRGTVTSLENKNQQPRLLLEIAEGQSILCLCNDLLRLEIGQNVTLFGTLLGEEISTNTRWAYGVYPALELITLVP